MASEDFHLFRTNRREHWQRIAGHLRAHPEDLAIPLENIERWLALGRVHPAPILEWRKRIESAQGSPGAFEELIAYLRADNDDSEPLKSCSPFVGLPLEPSPTLPRA